MKKALLLLLLVCGICACHRPVRVVESKSEVLMIDSTLDQVQDTDYLVYIAPIKADLEKELNIAIGHAPEALTVHKPECTMLNWASDALLAMAKQLYPNKVDIPVSSSTTSSLSPAKSMYI